jgi:hypothetical protein
MRKKAVLFMISMLSIFAIRAQSIDTLPTGSQQQYLKYMKKRSTHKTIGWLFLGTGAALAGGFFLINNANGWNGTPKGDGMFEAGIASTALSIPFFIIAGENKRKAKLALPGKVSTRKGKKSVAAGLLVAVSGNSRTNFNPYEYSWGTGLGIEVIGQSIIADKSALLLQLQLTRFRGSLPYTTPWGERVVTPISLKAGYRYRFTASGFYANVLAGLEHAKSYGMYLPAAVGVGKRIALKDKYFVDTGIDFTGGFVSRFNIKAVFSLLP